MELRSDQTPLSADPFELRGGFEQKPPTAMDLLRLIGRRWALILGVVTLAMALAFVALYSMTTKYSATADIIIDAKSERFTSIAQVLADVAPDKESILSEIEVLRSRNLVETIVNDFQLVNDPEFNDALRPKNLFQSLGDWLTAALQEVIPADRLLIAPPPEGTDPETSARDATVDAFLESFDVAQKGQSRAISVTFTSESPGKAARLANALADAYLLAQLDAKYEATRRANQWLAGKLAELRQVVADSESAVEEYRKSAGLLRSKDGTLISQQVSDLNAQLIVARTETAAAESRLREIRRLVQSPSGAAAAADVLGSPIILELLRQETEVKRNVAQMARDFGERHPRMINARNELENVESKIALEVDKVVQKLENEHAVARAREASLQRSLLDLEDQLARANAAEVTLRSLERDSVANKSMLEIFLKRFGEVSAQSDLAAQQTNTRIISRAIVPERPSQPKRLLILAGAFIAAFAGAVALALALENMESGFRSGDEIESATGVRTLGLVPILGNRGVSPIDAIVEAPASMFTESIRSLYTGILISGRRPTPRSVMITSSQPEEGKSTLALCLARMCALSGRGAVVIDADLRKPSLHRMLGAPLSPGLVNVFHGDATLDEALWIDEKSGLSVLTAGALLSDPVMILASPKTRQMLAALTERFDLTVIDTPPLMAVADARVIAPGCDASVFVVRWLRTHREVVRQALRALIDTGAHVGGVALTRVDARKHARAGYGDSGYYSEAARRYHTG